MEDPDGVTRMVHQYLVGRGKLDLSSLPPLALRKVWSKLNQLDIVSQLMPPAMMLQEYRELYPKISVNDGFVYTCILAKPGMPYVLLLGENHDIECEDSSRILSQPAVMKELLKDGDHFMLEDKEQNHDNITNKYSVTGSVARINKLRIELQPCLAGKWVTGKTLHPEYEFPGCKYKEENKMVQFHWLDYGLGWDNQLDIKNCDSTLTHDGKQECYECDRQTKEPCKQDDKCDWKDGKCIALEPTGIQVIPQGIDKRKLDTNTAYREEVTTMIKNSLVHSLLDLEEPACKDLGKGGTWLEKRRECLGYRNQEFPGGTCVFDNKGVEYQNTPIWHVSRPPRPKCRSMYDYIHHELHKPKCEGFQMPTPEALAEWFVSGLKDTNLQWQNFHIIRRIMEVYTLLRMFRKFDQPAKRCIVYAGANHSEALAKLLVDTQGYVILDKYDPSAAVDAASATVNTANAEYEAAKAAYDRFDQSKNEKLAQIQEIIGVQGIQDIQNELYDKLSGKIKKLLRAHEELRLAHDEATRCHQLKI